MKGELGTIHQLLMPEAAVVLNKSIAEAARRSHAQTTPLHVAATLLASPLGVLRQACLQAHPTTINPLHTRALDLCFSIALDRLPTTCSVEPSLSNALVAALKRAQAHQRRGCPEQQQQPLLAVKVEVNELIVSILDDPSVSRVMREASFSSPAVKATIEQSITSQTVTVPGNVYINPRLATASDLMQEEVKQVLDILSRSKKRNPILVGDSGTDEIKQEVIRKIEQRGITQVISLSSQLALVNQSHIPFMIRELSKVLITRIESGSNVVLDLGNLKWLVESVEDIGNDMAETGRATVKEMGRLLARFRDSSSGSRLWVVGTATCEVYLRCQVYHPTMESNWDVQPLPIVPKSPHSRNVGSGVLISSVESLAPSMSFNPRQPEKSSPRSSPISSLLTTQSTYPRQQTDQSIFSIQVPEPLASPVTTELILGQPKKPPDSNILDSDSLKMLYHGLKSKVYWQPEAAAAVSTAIMQTQSGTRNRFNNSWMLFVGPDRTGKLKMASALSEFMFGIPPVTIHVNPARNQSNIRLRGKTALDRAADIVSQNAFAVILLENIDQADTVIVSNIKQAIKNGRIANSYGREVNCSNATFILTADWLPENVELEPKTRTESLQQNGSKRRSESLDHQRPKKREAISLSLSLGICNQDNEDDGSDLTVDRCVENVACRSLMEIVDEIIVFKGVEIC